MTMKNIYVCLIFLVFVLTGCQKDSDIIESVSNNPTSELISTMDFSWWVIVQEEESLNHWGDLYGNSIHNASVKLMFKGEALWVSNSNESGRVTFPEQAVPVEGAYFLFEAPGFYPLVIEVQGESIPLWRVTMIRNTFPNINGEAISDAESYITLTGLFQDPSTTREAWFYVTNSDNELIGNALTGPEASSFYLTTLPNEDLFLHYNVECSEETVIFLGSFSESQDIGVLVDESIDFSFETDRVFLTNIRDCVTEEKLYGYDLFYKKGNLTIQSGGNSIFDVPNCETSNYPILLSVATQNPRKYVELTINHTPGQTSNAPDQKACEDDDTFLAYAAGTSLAGEGSVFTFANILPDGQMVIKQADHSLTENRRVTMVFTGSTTGSQNCNLNIVVRKESGSNGWSYVSGFGGHELNATITKNDGVFIEGTFSGEVMDAEEASLGILEGSFRARVQ